MPTDLDVLWAELPWLRRQAAEITRRSPDDPDELAQDILLFAWRHWDRYDPTLPIRPWLSMLMRRRWLVRLANQRNRTRRLESLDAPTTDKHDRPFADLLPAHQPASDTGVYDMLKALPDGQADLLEAHYLGGYLAREIAREIGVPAGTASSRIDRARRAARATTASRP